MKVRVKKYKVVLNNHLRGSFGAMNPKTNLIEINKKAHHGDKKELASTIAHEIMHVKHPNATEKQVYKKTAKTKLNPDEQRRMLEKLKGARREKGVKRMKRKLKINPNADVNPGDLYNRSKEISERKRVAIMGLI